MSRVRKIRPRHVALILVEGETEEEFYGEIARRKLVGVSKKIKNLKGNYNINAKIADAALQFTRNNPDDTFDVYVCVDQEKIGAPPYNERMVRSELEKIQNYRELHNVIAVLMIESLFFIDIDGLYNYLRADSRTRNSRKYINFRALKHDDLSRLFREYDKSYYKGIRCKGLVSALDLNELILHADELRYLLDTCLRRSRN